MRKIQQYLGFKLHLILGRDNVDELKILCMWYSPFCQINRYDNYNNTAQIGSQRQFLVVEN